MGRAPPPESSSLFLAILAVATGAMTVLCLLVHGVVGVFLNVAWPAAVIALVVAIVAIVAVLVARCAVSKAREHQRFGESTTDSAAEQIEPDTIYAQLYIEMRRFGERDRAVVTWYTTILLAMIGAVIGYWPHFDLGDTGALLELKVTLAALIVAVTGTMHYLIWHTNRRYRDLRDYTNNHYDIEPNRPALDLRNRPLPGHTAIIILFWILTFAFGCVLLHLP